MKESRGKYKEKFLDPRWQKKRLEIFNRDQWTCQLCFSLSKTLHIHHKYYQNTDPWDYDSTALITLCEECHSQESLLVENYLTRIKTNLKSKFLSNSLEVIADSLESEVHTCSDEMFCWALCNFLDNISDVVRRYVEVNRESA